MPGSSKVPGWSLKVKIFLVFVLLWVSGDAVMGLAKGAGDCRILKVIDGDTVTLWCGVGGIERARLVGFDTPELFSPKCFSERYQAIRATFVLRGELWAAGWIEVRTEGRGRYGRVLADVRLDGWPLDRIMVGRGLARAYDGGRRRDWCQG